MSVPGSYTNELAMGDWNPNKKEKTDHSVSETLATDLFCETRVRLHVKPGLLL